MSDWISVMDRMPLDSGPVLVFANDIVSSWTEAVNCYICPEYGSHVFEDIGSGEEYVPIITHWMPLPPPPQS